MKKAKYEVVQKDICAKCNSSTIKKKKFHEAKKNTFFLKTPKDPCVYIK